MALILKHTTGTPLGEFDALDTDLTAGFLGGEVVTFGSVVVGASVDKSAADSADGYIAPNLRVVVKKVTAAGAPYMLVDDGLSGYGVMFGVVVGGTIGQVSYGATNPGTPLGPATYVGSGKLTCWATPGLFGVTLDAVDTATVVPTSASCVPGAALYPTTGGKLSLTNTFTTPVIARFVDFETNRALVTTPNRLVAALNSPSSTVSGVLPNQLNQAVISFWPGQ